MFKRINNNKMIIRNFLKIKVNGLSYMRVIIGERKRKK